MHTRDPHSGGGLAPHAQADVEGRHMVDHQDAGVEGWKCWTARTRKRGEACGGRPESAKTVKRSPHRPPQRPVCQLLGSADVETTPAGTQTAAAIRIQRPDAARAGKNR